MAVHLVLLAGGRGTRFWPLSRRSRPKQLLPLLGDESLLAQTWRRVAPLGRPERAWLLTGADLLPACRSELPEIPAARCLGEPVGRNTAAAIALAGVLAAAEDPGAVLAVFPTDHRIADAAAFRRQARRALACAREERTLVTLGIRPDRAEPGYGWIETDGAAPEGVPLPVRRFVEKPSAARSKRFLDGGRHLWNSGMFFLEVGALARAFAEHAPEIWDALAPLAGFGERKRRKALAEVYPSLPSLPFDVAIMEKAAGVRVIRADFGWSDIGNWEALGELLPEQAGNRGTGDLVGLDASDNIVVDSEGLTALVGVKGLVVVRAGDVVLVCRRDRAQSLRELVASLADAGHERFI